MGSDLDRRGLPTTLPLWSAVGLLERPDLVRQIHLDNLLAGADIITTDTFRTTARTLRKAGIDPARAAELDALAVRLAVEARDGGGASRGVDCRVDRAAGGLLPAHLRDTTRRSRSPSTGLRRTTSPRPGSI